MKKIVMILVFMTIMAACSNATNTTSEKKTTKETKEESTSSKAPDEIPDYPKAVQRETSEPLKTENISSFQSDAIINENKATYNLELSMDHTNKFTATAEVKVQNNSNDTWNEILFYFIPHAFTAENKPEFMENAAEVSIDGLSVDSSQSKYMLKHDTLYVPLDEGLKPGEERVVTVQYTFTVPSKGIRFSRNEDNFYLAQWYPMLATYHSGWRKDDYVPGLESFFTAHSDFTVKYNLPKEYTIFSTSDNDPAAPSKSGELHSENVKEFFLALTTEPKQLKKSINGVEVRVAGPTSEETLKKALKTSVAAIEYFSDKLSPYPHKQIDIIADDGGMEYPGIVTVGNTDDNYFHHVIVHEIAHQWFYGVVSNDTYNNAYIDEGLTNFSTYMYFIGHDKKSPKEAFERADMMMEMNKDSQDLAGLPLDEYKAGAAIANYEIPSLKLWELAGNEKIAFNYLNKYVETYSYKQVDTYEWLRFTKSYFKVKDDSFFSDWIDY